MRTTIDLDDSVFRELKRIAAQEHATLRSVIEDALRAELARRKTFDHDRVNETVVTYKGRGTQPGVNIDSNADLLDLMEGRE